MKKKIKAAEDLGKGGVLQWGGARVLNWDKEETDWRFYNRSSR